MAKRSVLLAGSLALLLLSLTACDNKVSSASEMTKPTLMKPDDAQHASASQTDSLPKGHPETKTVRNVDVSGISGVFIDTARIAPNGKPMMLVFGSDACKYCTQLKGDIKGDSKMLTRLKEEFSSYYLSLDRPKEHTFVHSNSPMQVNTRMLAEIYGVQATPTLIFSDDTGKSIFTVPGYMPIEQFHVTLDFIHSRKWEGLDRKDGSVYEALKAWYVQKGIIKG